MPFRDLEECQQISKIISRLSTQDVLHILHLECCEILICFSSKKLDFDVGSVGKVQKFTKKKP
jgi:hypothetical protein